jgi:hypothetical protein
VEGSRMNPINMRGKERTSTYDEQRSTWWWRVCSNGKRSRQIACVKKKSKGDFNTFYLTSAERSVLQCTLQQPQERRSSKHA